MNRNIGIGIGTGTGTGIGTGIGIGIVIGTGRPKIMVILGVWVIPGGLRGGSRETPGGVLDPSGPQSRKRSQKGGSLTVPGAPPREPF